MWDTNKLKCIEKALGSFSITVKLNSGEEGSFWLTLVYDPIVEEGFLVGASRPVWFDFPNVVCRKGL